MNDQQIPPVGPGPNQLMTPHQNNTILQLISSYTLDKDGNVLKDRVSTICPFAPRPMVPKAHINLNIKPSADDFQMGTFPCTTRCPKCNVLQEIDPVNNILVSFQLEISCNGSVANFPLPMPEENQPAKMISMGAVK